MVYTEEMTWGEIKNAVESLGMHTILIPTGGTEQNGAHMVTGKHNYIVRETAGRIAATLGDTLVAPVIPYVPEGTIAPPEGHMRFAGTVSLSDETFERVLAETARSFHQHGFTVICFIGDHGSSQAAQARVAQALTREWESAGVKVLQIDAYYSEANGQEKWLLNQGEKKQDIEGHAALSDTSELLASHPEGVRIKALKEGNNGATGSAEHASKAYGKQLLGMKVDAAVAQIRTLRGQ